MDPILAFFGTCAVMLGLFFFGTGSDFSLMWPMIWKITLVIAIAVALVTTFAEPAHR